MEKCRHHSTAENLMKRLDISLALKQVSSSIRQKYCDMPTLSLWKIQHYIPSIYGCVCQGPCKALQGVHKSSAAKASKLRGGSGSKYGSCLRWMTYDMKDA
jgi:hypothetical protein